MEFVCIGVIESRIALIKRSIKNLKEIQEANFNNVDNDKIRECINRDWIELHDWEQRLQWEKLL